MGLFNWWKKESVKKLPEGQENIEQIIEDKQEENNIIDADYDSKIKFSINASLRDYDEWYQHFHSSNDKYEGPISVYRSENEEYIVTMNYRNGDQKDSVVLAFVRLSEEGENLQKVKYLTRNIDKMLEAMYDKSDFRYPNLRGYLNESFDIIKDRFDIEFTDEGEKILLNPEKKFIYTDKTTTLEKDNNECILGYKQIEDLRNYNAFEIPNEKNSYAGQTTITVPVKKCDVEKISDRQKKMIISQLKELYQTSANLGMFEGKENNSVEQYRRMIINLRKNKI